MTVSDKVRAHFQATDPDLEAIEQARHMGALADDLVAAGVVTQQEREAARRFLCRLRADPSQLALLDMDGLEQVEADAVDERDTVTIDWDAREYRFTFWDGGTSIDWDAPFDEVSEWCWWYPTQGMNLTRRECSLQAYQQQGRTITERWMARALKVMGIQKGSPPLAPHELARLKRPEQIEALVFQRRQARAQIAINASERRQMRTLLRKARAEVLDTDRALEHIGRMMQGAPRAPLLEQVPQASNELLAVVSLADAHIGKRAAGAGLQSTVAAVKQCAHLMAAKLQMLGAPAQICLALAGDYLHVDNAHATTTRGTPQDTDSSAPAILWGGIQAAIYYCDVMRQIAPVNIVIVPGNHDRLLTYAVAAALAMRYDTCDDVQCDYVEANRRYLQWGSSLIGFEHGDGPKPARLASIMASEQRQAWAQAAYAYWMVGHLHHEHIHDVDGVTILQCSSLSRPDAYHDKAGYVMSRPAQNAYVFDQQQGLLATLRVTPDFDDMA